MCKILCFSIVGLLGVLPFMAYAVELNFASSNPEKKAEMEKYVEQLGDPSWQVREEAGRRILENGMDALDVLEKAMESSDLTTATAAKYYYATLSHGMVRSSDSPKVQEILANYGIRESMDITIITQLSELSAEEGIVPLTRIVESENRPAISLRAAAAVLWSLPYPVVLHPTPSILPSKEDKKPTDEAVLLTREDVSKTWKDRKEYVEIILNHLEKSTSKALGILYLKAALETEISPNEALLSQVSEEQKSLVKEFTSPENRMTPTKSIALLEWEYLRAEQLARLISTSQGDTFLEKFRKASMYKFSSLRFHNDAERGRTLLQRMQLVERLFGRGLWTWGTTEGQLFISSIQTPDSVVLAQFLASVMHYAGKHNQAAETLLRCLQNPVTRTALRRYDLQELDFQTRAKYYLACQAGVENNTEKQKKLLDEILSQDPLEADSLILCWRLAETGSDDAWKEKISQRIDTALVRMKENIDNSSNVDRSKNQNIFAWLAANTHRRLDEALDAARAAMFAEPESGGIRDTLGHVLFAQGKYAEAVQEQKQAVQCQPDDLEIRRNLWRFEEKLEESTKANLQK